jgi:mannose-6-phosphate isomerase-like protein (cupin superfamily)
MAYHTSLTKAEIIYRPYGTMHRLATATAGLKNHQLLFMRLDAEQKTSHHHHPQEEIYFVLRGNPIFLTKDGPIHAQPLDTLAFFANEEHQVSNPSKDEPCEILIAISPLYNPAEVVYV